MAATNTTPKRTSLVTVIPGGSGIDVRTSVLLVLGSIVVLKVSFNVAVTGVTCFMAISQQNVHSKQKLL